MKIVSAKNPARSKNGGVDITVTFEGLGEIPFHATAGDTEPHGRELYARTMAGEFGPVAPYAAPVVSLEDVKAAKLTRINDAKNTYLDGGFKHNGVLFDSDIKARAAYLELAYKFGQDPTYVKDGWKASTGVWVTMDAALFAALQPDYEAHIDGCLVWQKAREMEVAAAQSVEEVEAVSEVM